MKKAILCVLAFLAAGPAAANPLAPFIDTWRPILIFAPDRYDQRIVEQKGRFSMHRREYRDRHVTLVEIGGPFMRAEGRGVPHGPEMRARFDVPNDRFTIILLDKDGAEQMRVHEVTDPLVFFEQIDTLPRRQEEMAREGG